MDKLPKFKKRKSRSPVVLDVMDIYLLHFISESEHKYNQLVGSELETLKKMFKLTHGSLVIHIRRLHKLKLIDIIKLPPKNTKKIISTTGFGDELIKNMFNTINSDESFTP